MKALSILMLFLLFGCAPSTHNLIEQAHLTGDWSLVNKRIEAEEKQYAREDALTLARERYEARLQAWRLKWPISNPSNCRDLNIVAGSLMSQSFSHSSGVKF